MAYTTGGAVQSRCQTPRVATGLKDVRHLPRGDDGKVDADDLALANVKADGGEDALNVGCLQIGTGQLLRAIGGRDGDKRRPDEKGRGCWQGKEKRQKKTEAARLSASVNRKKVVRKTYELM